MKSVSIKTARANLAEIIENALRGSTTIITRRGKNVAVVAPVPTKKPLPLPDLTDFRKSIEMKGKPLSAIVIEQRRKSRY